MKRTYEPDFICFDKVVVEIKAVTKLADEHRAQMLNYLHATGLNVGLLVNFGHYPKLEYERMANTKKKSPQITQIDADVQTEGRYEIRCLQSAFICVICGLISSFILFSFLLWQSLRLRCKRRLPDTIFLPIAPGSIEGLGESFEPALNNGTLRNMLFRRISRR